MHCTRKCLALHHNLTVHVSSPLSPPSSSKYPGQKRGLPRGVECARWQIGNSGVRVQRRTSSHHHLVQERQDGDGIGEPAHPGRATGA